MTDAALIRFGKARQISVPSKWGPAERVFCGSVARGASGVENPRPLSLSKKAKIDVIS
jgi:hypothetical protein